MKNLLKTIIATLLVILLCGVFVSCNTSDKDDDTSYYDKNTVYAQACSLGYTGTLDEFIELISGRDGKGIRSSLIDQNGHLIFVLTDGSTIDAGLLPTSNDNVGVFNVTFDFGDGNVTTIQSSNYRVDPPKAPEKEGYTLLYWYCEDEFLGELTWSFDAYAVTKDITLYARWEIEESDDSTADTTIDLKEIISTMEPVTITFYHTMGSSLRAVLDVAIEDFNKLYPNITVVHEQVGSYDDVRDTIKTEIAVGAQPNLAYCYPDHVALYNLANAVVKLDDLIASEITVTRDDGTTESLGLTAEQIADFIDGFYAEGSQFGDGNMYTLPLSKSTEVLYYNKTFFDEHNLTVPTTWDEMETLCKKIKEIDPQCIPLGYDTEANWFITMTEQLGSDYTSATGDHFLFANDTNYEFVERFRDWYQKGYVTTQELNGGMYTSGLFTATEGKRSYMSIASSAGANHQCPSKDFSTNQYPFEVGITAVPQVDPSNPKAISQGPSLCILNNENPYEIVASWLFMKFLTTDVTFQAKFSIVSGYMPVIESATENETYANFLSRADGGDYITALAAKVCLEQADAYYTSPAFNGSSTARDQVGILLQNCFTQTPASGESLRDMIKRLFQNAIEECEYQSS